MKNLYEDSFDSYVTLLEFHNGKPSYSDFRVIGQALFYPTKYEGRASYTVSLNKWGGGGVGMWSGHLIFKDNTDYGLELKKNLQDYPQAGETKRG